MARNRLQQPGQYGDQSAPAPPAGNPYALEQPSYPPAPQQQQQTGYAQQQPTNAYAQRGNGYVDTQPQQPQPYAFGPQSGGAAYGNGNGGDFWSQLSATDRLLNELENKIAAVRTAHQNVFSSAGSPDQAKSAAADAVTEEARALRQECAASVKSLFKAAKGNPSEVKQANRAKNHLRDLVEKHLKIEEDYRAKNKATIERRYLIVQPDATPEQIREVVDNGDSQVFQQALLQSSRMTDSRGALHEVKNRHAELQKIERNMAELGQMMQELSMLVEQQDESIVAIEQNMQDTDYQIGRANVELDGAKDKARKARRKKRWCFIFIVLLCIAIIAAIVVPSVVTQVNK